LREASSWRRPFAVGEGGAPDRSLLPIAGAGFADGALKGAQDSDGVVLRVFAGPDGAEVTLPADIDTEPCRLDETPTEHADPVLRPAEIRSWRIRP